MKGLPIIFFLLLLPAVAAGSTAVFADAEQGAELLSTADEFTRELSPFDRQARMRVAEVPDAAEFLAFIGKSAIDWPVDERRLLEESWTRVTARLKELGVALPDGDIPLVRTDGTEDTGAAYTRGRYIVFHPGTVNDGKHLDGLLAHELFHVISRHDPVLRDRLYAVIGFEPCGKVAFPESIAGRKMTNPDAPFNQHSIGVEIGGEPARVVPILVAARAFDHESDDDLLSYLRLQFLVIEKRGERWVAGVDGDGDPKLVSRFRLKKFSEQIGRNTGYIIHPEEILAENFRHWVNGKEGLPDPEIVEEIREVFASRDAGDE